MRVIVVGGGIGGLAGGIALHDAGLEPLVLERSPELTEIRAGLGLAANALRAIDHLGAADGIRALASTRVHRRLLAEGDAQLQPGEMALRGRDLRSCQNGRCRMRRDIPRYVELLERGTIDAGPIITSRRPLAEINDALEAAAARRGLTAVVVP
jgi:2-polyprenyl-6-methoxyphenol hydroxylase-like FAD-dependent oxidoreductase